MTQSNDFCLAFIILFVFILIFTSIGTGFCYRNEIKDQYQIIIKKLPEEFTNMYSNWEQQLKTIKKTHNIGEPTGVLSYKPDQVSCDTAQNLLVQSNVAFKPVKHSKGCTYVDKRWPA